MTSGKVSRLDIGIDVGGTFTDYVATDHRGTLIAGKVPSRPDREAEAVLAAIGALGEQLGLSVQAVLQRTGVFVLGSTVAANTILEMDGAIVGVITTAGFRDVLELRRNFKESATDLRLPPPFSIAPRRLRIGVAERIDMEGRVVIPLDEAGIRAAVKNLREQGVEAIAVCFLFSFSNPAHELRAREIIREELPGAQVSLSHEILPKVREFERFSTTTLNAYLTPRYERYLSELIANLRSLGLSSDLFVMLSNGGMMPGDSAKSRGVEGILSGPSGGISAAMFTGAQVGEDHLITADMGGTSYDVCVVVNSTPELSDQYWINRHLVALPMLDIHTIGAGGGSIAYVDKGGALRVGPESAGADPGPACFGKGGTRPTVTDANLVLGFLNPEAYLGGKMALDLRLAREAIEREVASKLGIDILEAAKGIFRIVNNGMANAIRQVTISKGRDPRDFALMAFGGAAGIHAASQARELGIRRVYVPKYASVFSAFGCLIADIKITRASSLLCRLQDLNVDQVNRLLTRLREQCEAPLNEVGGEILRKEVQLYFYMRYFRQVREVTVPVRLAGSPGNEHVTRLELDTTLDRFQEMHEKLYGYQRADWPVEVTDLRLDFIGRRAPVAIHRASVTAGRVAAPAQHRMAWLPEEKEGRSTAVYKASSLLPGDALEGPGIIEETNTTLLILDGQRLSVDGFGNYQIEDIAAGASPGGIRFAKEPADA